MKKIFLIIGGVVLIGLIASIFLSDQKSDVTTTQADDGTYVNDPRSVRALLTDPNVESSIDVSEVLSGGVPKDGIPSIDNPEIVGVSDVPGWIDASSDGIAVSLGGVHRFYPYQVLVHHEIVNDVIADQPILVTYCPLCYTGIVFNRVLEGRPVEFGVSGSLHNSNLIMYNRSAPESLWAQASGEAIIGPRIGQGLEIINFDITTFESFSAKYSDGELVVGDISGFRGYGGELPYGGDLRSPNLRFENSGEEDDRLAPDARVVGLMIDGQARAYHIESVQNAAPFADEFAGRQLLVDWDQDLAAVRVFDVTDSNAPDERMRLPLSASFWFSWVSTYPETTVFIN